MILSSLFILLNFYRSPHIHLFSLLFSIEDYFWKQSLPSSQLFLADKLSSISSDFLLSHLSFRALFICLSLFLAIFTSFDDSPIFILLTIIFILYIYFPSSESLVSNAIFIAFDFLKLMKQCFIVKFLPHECSLWMLAHESFGVAIFLFIPFK